MNCDRYDILVGNCISEMQQATVFPFEKLYLQYKYDFLHILQIYSPRGARTANTNLHDRIKQFDKYPYHFPRIGYKSLVAAHIRDVPTIRFPEKSLEIKGDLWIKNCKSPLILPEKVEVDGDIYFRNVRIKNHGNT